MHTSNVSSLKNNPTQALRLAQSSPVLVLNRDKPHALMVGLDDAGAMGLDLPAARRALAAALLREGGLSLVAAARLAQCTLPEMVRYLALRGIAAVNLSAGEAQADLSALDTWLAQA